MPRSKIVTISLVFLGLLLGLVPLGAGEVRLETAIKSSEIPAAVERDFGTVIEGQAVVLVLKVSNEGDEVLDIGGVRPGCACMSEQSDRSIAPGESGQVTLRLETIGYSGPTKEAALIQWVDGPVAVTRVELGLTVQPVLEVLPRRLVRFRSAQGQSATESVEIRRHDKSPFKITRVEPSSAFIQAKVTAAAEAGYEMTITLGPDAPSGMLRETVTLHTDLATVPTLPIKITGVVRAAE